MTISSGRFDPPIIGCSAAVARIRELILTLASSDVSVLITGDSGVGKEIVARNLHRFSRRRTGKFVSVNCAALAPGILESELFGHDRGAFTGAVRSHRGLFEQANGGTVFLDEIGEMPTSIQAKLLRVLQEGEVRRMGEGEVRRVDVRVLSATNVNLAQRIKDGSFRVDLFYRINVVEARIPCLRERPDDIPDLARFFLTRHRNPPPVLAPEAVNTLLMHGWPGNVRELQNEMERVMALYSSPAVVTPEMFSDRVARSSSRVEFDERILHDAPLARAVSYLEENLLKKALIRSNWNKSQTARALGLSRQGLLKKIKRYGITRDSFGLTVEENSS